MGGEICFCQRDGRIPGSRFIYLLLYNTGLYNEMQAGPSYLYTQTPPPPRKLIYDAVEDELRSFTAWGKKLLCSLVARQQILLYLLPDGSRMNWLKLGGYCSLAFFRICRHLTGITDAQWMGTNDLLSGFNHPLQCPPAPCFHTYIRT